MPYKSDHPRKSHRGYRLSAEACETLNKLKAMTGASETAIVEMAIAFYGVLVDKTLKGGSWLPKPSLPEPKPEPKPARLARFLDEFDAAFDGSDEPEPKPEPASEFWPGPKPELPPWAKDDFEPAERGVSAKKRSRPRRRRRF